MITFEIYFPNRKLYKGVAAKAQKQTFSRNQKSWIGPPFITPLTPSPSATLFHIAGTPFFNGADAISYFLLSIPPYIFHLFSLTLGYPGNVFYLSVVVDLLVCFATSQFHGWKRNETIAKGKFSNWFIF